MDEEELNEMKTILKSLQEENKIIRIIYPYRPQGRKTLIPDKLTFTYLGKVTQVFGKHFRLVDINGREYYLKTGDIIDINIPNAEDLENF